MTQFVMCMISIYSIFASSLAPIVSSFLDNGGTVSISKSIIIKEKSVELPM